MTPRTAVAALLVWVGIGLAPEATQGQAVESEGLRVAPGVAFEVYRFSEADAVGLESIRLVTLPFVGRFGSGPVSVRLSGAWASGTVGLASDADVTLSGLVDTEVRVDYAVIRDRVSLAVRGFLPTGVATHDADESLVASVVSSDLLPFRLSNWGTGGGLMLEGTATHRFGGFGAGASVSWGRSGEFEPISGDETAYRPGDQISVRAALDTEFGRSVKGSLLVGVRNFSDDRLDGRNLFRSGNRIEGLVSLAFPVVGGGSASVYGGFLHRQRGTSLLEISPDAPSQDLFLFGTAWRLPFSGGWLSPRADVRLQRRSDGVDQGYHLGLGSSAEFALGSRFTLVPVVMGRFGEVRIREGSISGFTGLEVGLSVRGGR